MTPVIAPAAADELNEAAAYYEAERPGLGREFTEAFRIALADLAAHPKANAAVAAGARRKRLKRFPYGIVYKFDPHTMTVYADMHLARRPGYWLDRLRS